ncbi:MAG: flagellar hook-associated protein FlgK [Lachnospiraceae bacterium]|nr:flagellar hook-associated protein FlgK [Lachnospiraceae bacterium]
MPSQFFGLSIAGSGLRNANAALNTTANNISNVQTDGYSRQKVDSQAADALRVFATYGCAGAGVETLSIERVRDSFYDVKFWDNHANYGQYNIKDYYDREIEDYFNDDGTSGFVTIFNKMRDALQEVTKDASTTSTKANFVASVQALTDYFNSMYGNLQEVQKDINLEIKQCVDQINSISSQVATLSKQINVIELSGGIANDLRDQRDLLIDRLSEYVDVEIRETPIYDTNDPTRETGGTRYVVKIAGGQLLVDGNDYDELSCVARANDEGLNQTDVDGLYKIKWGNGNEFNLNNAALNGKLRGLVDLRDGNNGQNFNGKVREKGSVTVGDGADAVTKQTVTVGVSDDYLKALIDCNLPSQGEITIGNAVYYYDEWEPVYEMDGSDYVLDENGQRVVEAYKFTLDPEKGSSREITVNDQVKTQEALAYQGIPYYMTQMSAFLRSFTDKINGILTAGQDPSTGKAVDGAPVVATNAYGDPGTNLFACRKIGEEVSYKELETDKYGYYYMTAGTVSVTDALLNDADLLGSRSNPHVGVEECEQIKEVIDTLTTKSKFSFRNAPANQMLEILISDVALNKSNADVYKTTYEGLKNSIDNQRTSISGVDEDEEAVSLVKYQNNYTLASKMIQTLTEIYDQLILNTGV